MEDKENVIKSINEIILLLESVTQHDKYTKIARHIVPYIGTFEALKYEYTNFGNRGTFKDLIVCTAISIINIVFTYNNIYTQDKGNSSIMNKHNKLVVFIVERILKIMGVYSEDDDSNFFFVRKILEPKTYTMYDYIVDCVRQDNEKFEKCKKEIEFWRDK